MYMYVGTSINFKLSRFGSCPVVKRDFPIVVVSPYATDIAYYAVKICAYAFLFTKSYYLDQKYYNLKLFVRYYIVGKI
jgi:hypothetical protein